MGDQSIGQGGSIFELIIRFHRIDFKNLLSTYWVKARQLCNVGLGWFIHKLVPELGLEGEGLFPKYIP